MKNDSPKTFLDAQIAFAKSKQGREQRRKESAYSRYYQSRQAVAKAQAQGVNAGNNRGVSDEK